MIKQVVWNGMDRQPTHTEMQTDTQKDRERILSPAKLMAGRKGREGERPTCRACCLKFSSILTPQFLTVNRSWVSMDVPLVDPAKHNAFSESACGLATNYALAKTSLSYM